MNYIGITKTDIANGEGVRCVLWVSGCTVRCKGCHNPETWDFSAGQPFDTSVLGEIVGILKRPWIQGLTISGGNPLEYQNLPDIYNICKTVKELCPDKDIWLYTGYELRDRDFDTTVDIGWDNALLMNFILSKCDVVVDGPYVEALRDVSLRFRGSSNQRLIDVKKTREAGQIMLWKGEN